MGIQVRRTFDGAPRAYQVQVKCGERMVIKSFRTMPEAETFLRLAKEAQAREKLRARDEAYKAALKDPATAPLRALTVREVLDWHAAVVGTQAARDAAHLAKKRAGGARVFELSADWCRDFCERLLRPQDGGRKGGTLGRESIAASLSLIKTACARKADALGIPRMQLGLGHEHLPKSDKCFKIRERRLRGGEEALVRSALADCADSAEAPPQTAARHCQLVVDFAIETCASRNEALRLSWSEIDEAAGVWRLPATRSKSGNAREVALSKKALATLKELGEDRAVDNALVFHRLPSMHSFEKRWREAMKNAGIEDLRFGDLRHEGLMRRLEGSHMGVADIARELGRSRKTARRYSMVREAEQSEAHERARAFVETYAQLRDSFRATKPGSPARARIVAHMEALLEKRELEGALSAADAAAARAAFPKLPPRRL
ncbi:tyrosine-type recombinase/integrase [Ramlibacter sp.]|uniref:tyrosine-type recombinase/integrase n=1 Tax=Ramlibacter sp. TaxID=1917967 RepID=UPI003D0ACC88